MFHVRVPAFRSTAHLFAKRGCVLVKERGLKRVRERQRGCVRDRERERDRVPSQIHGTPLREERVCACERERIKEGSRETERVCA
jgi:hypothetical protein